MSEARRSAADKSVATTKAVSAAKAAQAKVVVSKAAPAKAVAKKPSPVKAVPSPAKTAKAAPVKAVKAAPAKAAPAKAAAKAPAAKAAKAAPAKPTKTAAKDAAVKTPAAKAGGKSAAADIVELTEDDSVVVLESLTRASAEAGQRLAPDLEPDPEELASVAEEAEAEDDGAIEIRNDDEDAPPPQVVTAGATADPVKDYLKQIGRVPLLNAEQEVELAKRIEAGLFAAE